MDAASPFDAEETAEETPRRPVVLSIAGFDPSSGAGATADLKVFAAHGLYGMACLTALTIQSTAGVRRVEAVSAHTVAETLTVLREDGPLDGVKVGMLATPQVAEAVADFLASDPKLLVVLDPVLRSTSGRDLLETGGIEVLRNRLLSRTNWITPNLEELGILTGTEVKSRSDIPAAAARLRRLAQEKGNPGLNVLVTGGHLAKPDDYLLTEAGEAVWITGERVETNATHVTGCALSSSLLCRLVLGDQAKPAAAHAKCYVANAMKEAYPVGAGKGPMNHLFALDIPGSL